MKVFLGADHQGYQLKEKVELYLAKRGFEAEDIGNNELDPADDFPQFAQLAAMRVLGADDSDDPRAILVCGSGQGMCMAANRFRGIRACVVWDSHEAKVARNDLNSNVLCLPARMLDDEAELWKDIIDTWLTTPFANAVRYQRRNREMDEM